MSLKQELLEKVPQGIKDELHFLALLDHIKNNNIENKEHLIDFLEQEISLVEKWLEDNKGHNGTGVKSIRDKAIKLDVLKKCLELSQTFLIV